VKYRKFSKNNMKKLSQKFPKKSLKAQKKISKSSRKFLIFIETFLDI
jgi:hypothetical protein